VIGLPSTEVHIEDFFKGHYDLRDDAQISFVPYTIQNLLRQQMARMEYRHTLVEMRDLSPLAAQILTGGVAEHLSECDFKLLWVAILIFEEPPKVFDRCTHRGGPRTPSSTPTNDDRSDSVSMSAARTM
jgi:hypothetical protein